ncbi:hypothetical protein CRE_24529 [Caenorhabditis remanei]|uniref:Uncharacterized protein n=1 Tax=Caenorhabditis remanei TaxID=31234 RepID=E3MV89_CAERE|nr:hypothetical protein CRE_24529 [Caenorhabditis remanei]
MKPLWFSLLILVPYCIGQRLTREYCLKRVNGFRAELAMERQVANMNELVYNEALEKKILDQLSIINGCPKRGMKITHDGFNVYLPVKFIPNDLGAPGMTAIACFEAFCMENGEKFLSIVTDHSDSSPISGTPGSQCPSGRTPGSDKLCSLRKPKVHSAYIRKGSRDIPKFSDESQEKSRNQYVRKNILGDYPDALKNGILVSYGPLPPANKGAYMRKSGWDLQSEWKSQNEEFGGFYDVWYLDGGSDYSQEADNDFETTKDPLDQSFPGYLAVEEPVSTTTDPHGDNDDDGWFIAVDNDFETTEDPLDQTDSGSPDVEKPVFTTTPFPKDNYASYIAELSAARKELSKAAEKINCKPPAAPFPNDHYALHVADLQKKKEDSDTLQSNIDS